jgi:hypothetical protein
VSIANLNELIRKDLGNAYAFTRAVWNIAAKAIMAARFRISLKQSG